MTHICMASLLQEGIPGVLRLCAPNKVIVSHSQHNINKIERRPHMHLVSNAYQQEESLSGILTAGWEIQSTYTSGSQPFTCHAPLMNKGTFMRLP